jgi:hypothetical protein
MITSGAKTDVIAIPKGYAAKMRPFQEPEKSEPGAKQVKKHERNVATV